MKLISKQQLEEKARQRHMRTVTEKGMRNAISLKEEEPAINWCVCIFSYTALHCPALSLFNLRKFSCETQLANSSGIIFYTAAN